MDEEFLISTHEIAQTLGRANRPRIIDVCLDEDHALDPRLIPGAERRAYQTAASSIPDGAGHCFVVCQKGLKLSQGVAAQLNARGIPALYLEGGMVAWAEAGAPLLPSDLYKGLGVPGLNYVLPRQLSAADCIAAWFVTRWCDASANWLFVQEDQVSAVADRFAAISAQSVATALQDIPGPVGAAFQKFARDVSGGLVGNLLQAHCSNNPPSAMGLASAHVFLDAAWKMCGLNQWGKST